MVPASVLALEVDARLPEGKLTLSEFMPPFCQWSIVEGLPNHTEFKDSDCFKGSGTRVPDGKRLATELVSHHYFFTPNPIAADVAAASKYSISSA